MSKIYEALKKAEQERERSRLRPTPRAPIPPGPIDHGGAVQEDYQRLRASVLSMAVPSGLHTVLIVAARHGVGSSRVDLQACKLEYSIVSPK